MCPICHAPTMPFGGEDVCTGHDDWLDDADAFDDHEGCECDACANDTRDYDGDTARPDEGEVV